MYVLIYKLYGNDDTQVLAQQFFGQHAVGDDKLVLFNITAHCIRTGTSLQSSIHNDMKCGWIWHS